MTLCPDPVPSGPSGHEAKQTCHEPDGHDTHIHSIIIYSAEITPFKIHASSQSMKQVNKLLHQLSYLSPYKNKALNNSDEAAGVELSSRSGGPSRSTAAQELVSLRLNRQAPGSHTAAQNGSSRVHDYDQHPLEAADSQGATPTATADSNFTDTPAAHGTNHSLDSVDDRLLQQLLNQAWLEEAPSSARLVLSLCWEVALTQQQQQHHVLDIVRLVVAATSWQAACTHCQDTLLLRCVPHVVGRSGLVDPTSHSGNRSASHNR